jgi:phosphoenolpyruvate synthase/pyruvate phosphate dikinase
MRLFPALKIDPPAAMLKFVALFQQAQCLAREMIEALWKAITEIERQFGAPIDIEWVIEPSWRPGAAVSIVQVRPITTLDAASEAPPAKWDALQYAAKYGLGIKAAPVRGAKQA